MFDLGSLNPQQREAVVTHDGPVLILAGAGTGKTRTLTCRIAHMIENGIAPGHILSVTFTNKAAREMLQRVNGLIPRTPRTRKDPGAPEDPFTERPTLCTFHSLCVRILRQHIEKIGYKKNFVIYDEVDQLAAMRKILSQISAKGEKTDPSAILTMLSKFKNGGADGSFGDPSVRALAEHVAKKYESALHACNAVDFDDLILLTLRLFREHPESLDSCRRKYRYVMVDEYQDTNASQFELVNHLTAKSRNLCVVGDDDQSIYGWRGAQIANILDLEKHFPEVKVIKLEQNYRSTNTILRAANEVIRRNTRRRGKTLWSAKGDGSKISLYTFDTDDEEARTVSENIEYDRVAQNISWGKQAILYRTNLQARPIETALRKARIRYHLIGGQSFFDRTEIKDVLAYLKTFVNPNDDISLLRIANKPARGLSDVTMERLLAFSSERSASVFTIMRHTDVLASFQQRTRDAISAFVRWIEITRAPVLVTSPVNLTSWAEAWLNETGYLEDLRRGEKDAEAADNRVRNVMELLDELDGEDSAKARRARRDATSGKAAKPTSRSFHINEDDPSGLLDEMVRPAPPVVSQLLLPTIPPSYTGKPMDRLDEFLADLTLDREREEDREEKGDQVILITLHAAKGLEFPHVHIVGVEEGLLPHARSKIEGTLDEERRLFYVGITRAQETLRISHCRGRRRYNQVMPCQPSAFLQELPTECVEDMEVAAARKVEKEAGGDWFKAMRDALK